MSLRDDVQACQACDRCTGVRKIGLGPRDFNVLVVVDAPDPGQNQDVFIGDDDAAVLMELFSTEGFDKRYKVAYTSLVKCGGGDVTADQLSGCLPLFHRQVAGFEQQFVVILFSRFVSVDLEGFFFRRQYRGIVYVALFHQLAAYRNRVSYLQEIFYKIF